MGYELVGGEQMALHYGSTLALWADFAGM